ncbi:MAG TPA: SpoIIE family protein phosphatase, partial [Candidatus Nitrosotalea sp.]|nr:SpoIIE family protein phosphatase [Candidatus Nitrosotalea sp.]
MRSLDANPERLDAVLEVLVAANAALLSLEIGHALTAIADSIARELAEYCEIEALLPERSICRVNAGRIAESQSCEGETIVESLTDGRQTLGRLVCRTWAAGGFDEVRRKALRVLATEMGVVLAGRLLAEREHRVADRLQRALLPEQLPAIPGNGFYAAYRPASDEADVGGDWFDAFALADGRVAVSVGDVAGHGLEAAVIMGEMRQAIRTAAIAAPDPAAVLDQVNRMVALREGVGMVTAIFGVYDPASSLLTYSSAGHPPPLLALA